jgi:CDP-diacylglycerol--glycerol-3-phosphate 3-phosphatidyltransferase
MTLTRLIGRVCDRIVRLIVRGLALSRIHPNALTLIGLVINAVAAVLLAAGNFWVAGWVITGAAIFDMVDGRVARETNQVTRFGGFFDSVVDRYSDLALLMGLLVYYASINRFGYIVLTAIVMTGSVMVSYTRSRAENIIPKCKVGFLERPERIVLLIIGALFNRMAAVLWVIAILSNLTVIHRMIFTWQEARRLGSRTGSSLEPLVRRDRLAKHSDKSCATRPGSPGSSRHTDPQRTGGDRRRRYEEM